MRIYFITPKQLAAILDITEYTVREWCKAGKYHAQKIGRTWRIPTEELRRAHRDLPVEFWEEIVEDFYKGLNGPQSAAMRLERAKQGKHPSNGKKVIVK